MSEARAMNETKTVESEVVEAGGCRKRVSVKIAPEEVAREFDETVRRYSKAVRMPGFRRGKVPIAIVRKRFAHEIEEEVRDHLVRTGLREAFLAHSVMPLHNPAVEVGEIKEGQPFAYTALFEVKPAIALGDYRGLPVTIPPSSVSDEEVERALDSLRERYAKFVTVEPRPLAAGDFALVDLTGREESGTGKDIKHEAVMIEVGGESNMPEFNEALPGMSVGESKSIVVSYPEDFGAEHLAGRRIEYALTMNGIKKKELPPADDEFPKDLGKEGTLDDLRGEIRKDLEGARRRNAEREGREALLRQLIEKNPVEVPEVLVEEQINFQIEQKVRSLLVQGIDPKKTEIDWSQARAGELPLAQKRVLGMLILEEIASREGLDVTDSELRQKIVEEARGRGEKPDDLQKRLEEAGSLQALKNQMVREKSLDFLMNNATITT